MMRVRSLILVTTSALCLAVGCNAILGNEEGTLRASIGSGEAGALDASVGDGDNLVDGKVVADATFDAALTCPTDKKACSAFGACVTPTDPNYGCGDPSCLACDTTNAKSVGCVGSTAGIVCKLDCNPGFNNCDGKNENGCEADFSKAATCGSCTNACPVGQFCSSTAGIYTCVAACPVGRETCGTTECIDKSSNASHCGACSRACAAPPHATATCKAQICGFTCEALYHRCGDTCVPDSEASACGTTCTNCNSAAPANTTPSCQAGGCVFGCAPGWADCNNDLKLDGCETNLLSDNGNCFKCGNACVAGPIILSPNVEPNGTYCCNGTCVPLNYGCANSN